VEKLLKRVRDWSADVHTHERQCCTAQSAYTQVILKITQFLFLKYTSTYTQVYTVNVLQWQ